MNDDGCETEGGDEQRAAGPGEPAQAQGAGRWGAEPGPEPSAEGMATERAVDLRWLGPALRRVLGVCVDPAASTSAEGSGMGPMVLDVEGWLSWMGAGLELFLGRSDGGGAGGDPGATDGTIGPRPHGPPLPRLDRAGVLARSVCVVLAMERHGGNVTHAAKALGVARRTLRTALHAAGAYPWEEFRARGARAERSAGADELGSSRWQA